MDKLALVISIGLALLIVINVALAYVMFNQVDVLDKVYILLRKGAHRQESLPPPTNACEVKRAFALDNDPLRINESMANGIRERPKPTEPPPPKPYRKPDVNVECKIDFDPALGFSEIYADVVEQRKNSALTMGQEVDRERMRAYLLEVKEQIGLGAVRYILEHFGYKHVKDVPEHMTNVITHAAQVKLKSHKAEEAPMQEDQPDSQETTTAPRHRTVISTLNEATLALNHIYDQYGKHNATADAVINKVRESINYIIFNHLEQELANDALQIQELIDKQKHRADTAERQLLEQSQQHRAEMDTLDEVHTRRTDQATRATVAVVLEAMGQRSITLDLKKVQTVWHRLDMSMQLVHGEDLAVKYTIDHYKAAGQ